MTEKVYIAGKVSKNSSFGKHHWRDEFCTELSELSGVSLSNLDPLKATEDFEDTFAIFAKDCKLINEADFVVVYLSDDISVGGSQEILIAKYLKKPVIGFAPYGGKFNGRKHEIQGRVIESYKDSFVFTTCDVVCGSLDEVAAAIRTIGTMQPKTLDIIDKALLR